MTPLTQIVVVIDSDLEVPAELDHVEVMVEGGVNMPSARASLAREGLPRSLGLVHGSGSLGPLRVIVRGSRDDQPVIERVAEVSFERDRTLKLALLLSRACAERPSPCAATQTCDSGECVSPDLPELPIFDGDVGSFDGGRSDAGAAAADGGSGGRAGRGGAGSPAAAGRGGSAGGGRGGAGAAPAAGRGGSSGKPGPNQPPDCTIDTPADNEIFYEGDTIVLSGRCSDPEDGELSVRWTGDGDTVLGEQTELTRTDYALGPHSVRLCASDLSPDPVSDCEMRSFTLEPLPAISASIGALAQGPTSVDPYKKDPAIIATGAGSGVPPLAYRWTDSLLGAISSEASATLKGPVPLGPHALQLQVTDGRGRTASDTRVFEVRDPMQPTLVAAYAMVNTGSVGDQVKSTPSLAADSGALYIAGENGVYRVSPSDAPSMATPALDLLTVAASPSQIFLSPAGDRAFISTEQDGVSSCSYAASTGIGDCVSFESPPEEHAHAAIRLTNGGKEYLVVGTDEGVYVALTSNIAAGSANLTNAVVYAFAASAQTLWVATSAGLYRYDLTATNALAGAPTSVPGSPTGLGSVVLTSTHVWVGSSAGLAGMELATGTWTRWDKDTPALFGRLIDNDVRGIAVAQPQLAGAAREVLWIATDNGVSRFDPAIPSFTSVTTAQGLP
ncbi:MAG: hypothetical protein ABW321_03555, partial [Polyangiales bacterium]